MINSLDNPAVKELREKLARSLKDVTVPKNGLFGMMSLSFWMAKVLERKDFDLLDEMEDGLGQDACNLWLKNILIESGQFVDAGDDFVKQVL